MGKHHQFIDTVDEIITNAVKSGLFHLYADDAQFDGRIITVNDRKLINFGSCSYLGLEVDDRLKQGAIDATLKYGTQLSASRAFLSAGIYQELEENFTRLFGNEVVIAPSTTLAHLSSMPVVIRDEDAVILDQQVHASVQNAIMPAKLRGIPVEMIRHSRLDQLEDMIIQLRPKHRRIWYMVDGVYSMYGDFAPLEDLVALQKKYEQLHLYIDDAHGMSWAGQHGRGFALSRIELNDRIVFATSLAKAFGTGGGVLVFSDPELKRKVRTCGSTMVFSGPIQPPMIGACLASAKIHLSDEILTLQSDLRWRIDLINTKIKEYNLPTISLDYSPVFFVGTGMPKTGYNLGRRLLNEGYYVNLAIFPGVPVKCTGIRFTATRHQTKKDIEGLLDAVRYHLPKAIEEEGTSFKEVFRAFKLPLPEALATSDVEKKSKFEIIHKQTIQEIDQSEWDNTIGNQGAYSWNHLKTLESIFVNNPDENNSWKFHYYLIRNNGKVIFATFFTVAKTKDDMFSPASVSKQIEKEREKNPEYLVSKAFSMGSVVSIGNHIYIDYSLPNWKEAFKLFYDTVSDNAETENANVICFRDFDVDNKLHETLLELGMFRIYIPDSHIIRNLKFSSTEEYLASLQSDHRYYVKRRAVAFEKDYDVKVVKSLSAQELERVYELYKNVARDNYEINVFGITKEFFSKVLNSDNVEMILLSLKPEITGEAENKIVGMALMYRAGDTYFFMVTGMDYNYSKEYNIYSQILWQIVQRANHLGYRNVNLGLTASQNKRKFDGEPVKQIAYVQAKDNYNIERIGLIVVKEEV